MANLKKIVVVTDGVEEELTLSEIGYRVQEDQVTRLLKRFENFSTVEMTDLRGRPLKLPLKRGQDGGIDVIFRITSSSNRGQASVYGKVKKILVTNDY
ncbi:hypothetical protein OC525_22220 [Vibrio vulnificus]|nr:hypothetical protein [Vibrio vulnificus]